MVNPIEMLWKDTCTIYKKDKIKNEQTKITEFSEVAIFEDIPCKLSFESLNSNSEDNVAAISQGVKLFLSSEIVIPSGSKIVVRRFNSIEREFIYSKSGEAGVFTNHQEIPLSEWKGYA